MGKRSVAKAVGVAFEPGPMGPAVDALVDRALTLALGAGDRSALLAIFFFFHRAPLALATCVD